MRLVPKQMRHALDDGVTRFCHCWQIARRDGVRLGLTDHDRELSFDATLFHAAAGIRLSALDTRQGLADNHPEAEGVLGSPHLEAADLRRGLYDLAAFKLWLVDWQEPQNRLLLLAGQFGPVRYAQGRFVVTLRSHANSLNQAQGRLYQRHCDAALGDGRCRVDLTARQYSWQGPIVSRLGAELVLPQSAHAAGWFTNGLVSDAAGQSYTVRDDYRDATQRRLVLWQEPPATLAAGDIVTVVAGCDKQPETCRVKFDNLLNFQGFPDLSDEAVLIHVGDVER